MNKSEFADLVAEKSGLSKTDSEKAVDAFTEAVVDTLAGGGEVALTGFGNFSVSERAARTGVNPQNPSEKIQIPATKVPKFKAGKGLKDAVKASMDQGDEE